MVDTIYKSYIGKNRISFYYDTIIYNDNGNLIYGSLICNNYQLKALKAELKRQNVINLSESRKYISTLKPYDFYSTKGADSDYSHLIVAKRDYIVESEDDDVYYGHLYIMLDDKETAEIKSEERYEQIILEQLNDKIYDKLYKNTSIPLIKEWIPYIKSQMYKNKYLSMLNTETINSSYKLRGYKIQISKKQLLNIIQTGLRTGVLTINNCNESSDLMKSVEGLDSYLNIFGDMLATRIQNSFKPKFDPVADSYDEYVNKFEDFCHYKGIDIYEAQKATIQATVNNFNKSNVSYIIGEMGSGKTLLSIGSIYSHQKKPVGSTNIVMCPSHLIEKWKREIERLCPNSKAYIISNIKDIVNLLPTIKNKAKRENSFLIISKETAKYGYEMRPAAIWSKSKNTFVCPICGQPLKKKIKASRIFNRESDSLVNFEKTDFVKHLQFNTYCSNKVRKFNKTTGLYEEKVCGANLWTPFNKDEQNCKWVKLGKNGWVLKEHVDDIINELNTKQSITRQERSLVTSLQNIADQIAFDEKIKGQVAPRKYPIAKFIAKYLKGSIDYFICDEMHLFKGESLQGQAMADINSASKYFLGLTGTLLNGYASGLFYILYRTLPQLMKAEKFEYGDEAAFIREYGVIQKTDNFTLNNMGNKEKVGFTNEKQLPGVSPLLFTRFLLENAVFISLSDMDGGLPGYEEIPMGIDMDDELSRAYRNLERDLRSSTAFQVGGMKVLGSLLQTLSTYPDMPYDQPDVIHPDTGEVLVTPQVLSRESRNKEHQAIELIKNKVAAGEKVLLYYEWTNRTDIAHKLPELLKEEGIKSAVLTSSVSAASREEWIDKQVKEKDIDVLICNPKLVETGLDLLDFTTIIFYQVGYNIFTLRQASRRSWRLSQDKDIHVYFLYYKNTIQEKALNLMATKLQASMAIEGKFSEEGLRAMSNNENLLTQIANSVVDGIKDVVEINSFASVSRQERINNFNRERIPIESILIQNNPIYSFNFSFNKKSSSNHKMLSSILNGKTLVGF